MLQSRNIHLAGENWEIEMASKTIALITGITGQDGSYLAEYLLKLDYIVIGVRRRTSNRNLGYLKKIYEESNGDFDVVDGDMTDGVSLMDAVRAVKPNEIYNLAAQSFVGTSWNQPMLTNDVNFMGTLRLLEACRHLDSRPKIYQASTSEMFGNSPEPQNEETSMIPRSPYGLSKLAAHRLCGVYRDSFNLFISCGILFNHESPRRGEEFVTRKIANGVARIVLLKDKTIALGDLASKRDWGYAGDFVRAMWLMLQQDSPDDFVIATGKTHSVQDFIVAAFEHVRVHHPKHWAKVSAERDYPIRWGDVGKFIHQDKKLMRPAEVYELRGDATKAKEVLGWEPSVSFASLVAMMVDAEIERERND